MGMKNVKRVANPSKSMVMASSHVDDDAKKAARARKSKRRGLSKSFNEIMEMEQEDV